MNNSNLTSELKGILGQIGVENSDNIMEIRNRLAKENKRVFVNTLKKQQISWAFKILDAIEKPSLGGDKDYVNLLIDSWNTIKTLQQNVCRTHQNRV